jgi:hypothetical protein
LDLLVLLAWDQLVLLVKQEQLVRKEFQEQQ